MFTNLTTTQLTALILGVAFSAIAVACSFFALRWSKKIKSKVLAGAITTIAPFIAITAWFFLIFSYVKGVKEDEIFNLFISMAISLVICFMILVVSSLLYRKNIARLMEIEKQEEEKERAKQEAIAIAVAKAQQNNQEVIEVEVEDAEIEENADNQEIDEVVEESEDLVEENQETLDEVEEIEELPEEAIEEFDEVEELEEETEELAEEDLDEVVEKSEETQEVEEVEPTPVEEETQETSDDNDDE